MLCNIYYILLSWQIYLTNYLEIQVWIQNSWTPWTSVWGELGPQLMVSSVFRTHHWLCPTLQGALETCLWTLQLCIHIQVASPRVWELSGYAECGLEGAVWVLSRHVPSDLWPPCPKGHNLERARVGLCHLRPRSGASGWGCWNFFF